VRKKEKNKLRKRTNIMKITIRVFGRYKDITKKDTIQLNIGEGNTLGDVIECFVKQYPATEKDKSRMMASKNKMYASFDTTVNERDEISLSPPVVSGG
jgi:molybdopterin converting factor small subunit